MVYSIFVETSKLGRVKLVSAGRQAVLLDISAVKFNGNNVSLALSAENPVTVQVVVLGLFQTDVFSTHIASR